MGKVTAALADTGYVNTDAWENVAAAGVDLYVAVSRDENHSQRRYARRKQTVEPVFGIIKNVMGFRQFLLRGLEKVQGEWELVRLAQLPQLGRK